MSEEIGSVSTDDREKIREERRKRRREKRVQAAINKQKNNSQSSNAYSVNLEDLIQNSTTSKKTIFENKNISDNVVCSSGNYLDSSKPQRKTGKVYENKKKHVSKVKSEKAASVDAPVYNTTYIDNIVTDKLEQLAQNYIEQLVVLQQKLFQRDPFKGDIKRRYVVGFHESKKYVLAGRVKLVVMPSNLQVIKNGIFEQTVEEFKCKCKEKDIPYVFVLSRRFLGKLTLKFVPVGCFSVLNYDGINELHKELLQELKHCKTSFISERESSNYDKNVEDNLAQRLMSALV